MSREEAETFVSESLALAMCRDGSSGGVIRMMTIDAQGAHPRYIPGNEVRWLARTACVCVLGRGESSRRQ